MREWIVPTLGALFLWGLWGFIPKITTMYINPSSAIVYEVVGAIAIAIIILISVNFQIDSHPTGVSLAIVTGMLGFLGAFCFLNAVTKGSVSLVATVSALYPVVSILLAVLILHEPLTLRQATGIALALVAMILVAA